MGIGIWEGSWLSTNDKCDPEQVSSCLGASASSPAAQCSDVMKPHTTWPAQAMRALTVCSGVSPWGFLPPGKSPALSPALPLLSLAEHSFFPWPL
jgi:hypothetical protein